MFLSKLSLRNPVMITMLTLALVVFGLVSVNSMGIELIPAMDVPVVTVSTVYRGADPQTIEEDVVKILEDSVGTISGIKHIDSTALDNVGITTITFNDDVNGKAATQDVRDKVALVRGDLPDDVDDPIVQQFDVQAMPIMTLVLQAPSGEKLSKVTKIAEDEIKNRIQSVQGVGSVDIYGGREREIRVLIDPLKARQLNLSTLAIINLLESKSIEIPGGTLKMLGDSQEVGITATGEAETLDDLRELPLVSINGTKVRLADLARVEDGLEEEESASMMNLTPAVALKVVKQGSVNQVEMANTISVMLDDIRKTLPKGYQISIVGDQGPFIKSAVGSTVSDVFVGALLAMAIIFLFLMNKRAALVVAVSLPTSIIGTFLFIHTFGLTLNIMSTLALSISVGILTDDAIVVIEAMFRHLKMDKPRLQAIIDATDEVGLAVISAELSLICVFGPTVIMHGTIGNLFQSFGLTVVVAIIISMTVSFTVAPLLASKILKEESQDNLLYRTMNALLTALENAYANAVGWVLNHRLIVIAGAILLLVGGMKLLGMLPGAFFPDVDRGEFDVDVELNQEASIDQSKVVTREMVELLAKYSWEEFAFSTSGGGRRQEKYLTTIRIMMTPKETRSITQFEAMDVVRKDFVDFAKKHHAKLAVKMVKGEGMDTTPIQANIRGNNFDLLRKASAMLIDFMQTDGGFADISKSDKGNKKNITIRFNHNLMNEMGVNPAETGMAVRYLMAGKKVTGIKNEDGEEVEVWVYAEENAKTLEALRSIPLSASNGAMVSLGSVADITYESKVVEINRLDRSRKIQVKSNLAPGATLGPQAEKLIAFAEANFPAGVSLEMGGDTEIMKESFQSLIAAMVIAIFLIYIVLASQFNSYIHPFTIMTALPFALVGAAVTMYIFNQPLSLMAFIGIIMLMGIVTKNSILLVDYTLQLIREGKETVPALIESSRVRLRPILMTAGGTIIGMSPAVLSTANAAEMKHGLGFAVMGGLIFSTFITLFIVPIFFSLVQRFVRMPSPEQQKQLDEL